MHVADRRQHGETKRALGGMAGMDRFMCREHAEGTGGGAYRHGQGDDVGKARGTARSDGAPQDQRELQDDVKPREKTREEGLACGRNVRRLLAERAVESDEDEQH